MVGRRRVGKRVSRLSRREKQERHRQRRLDLADQRSHERSAREQRRHVMAWGVPVDKLLDPLCGDPLGILRLTDRLDEAQYLNGVSYRDTALYYRIMQGLPSGLPKILGVKGVSHFEAEPARAAAVEERYLRYRRAIGGSCRHGDGALSVVHQVCSSDRMIETDEQLDQLRIGLSAMRQG